MGEAKPISPPPVSDEVRQSLRIMANRLRRDCLISTAEAGSGHPSTCLSCAELVSALFFRYLRYDLNHPKNPYNDRFVLSKGHAAPILWAALAEAGAFPVEKLLTLRRIDSDLEGHPTPRNPWVDVATGSLGQGLSIGVGMALAGRLDRTGNRIYVLLGDGETAEGAVWEAVELAAYYRLGNLIAVLDANRLGQSQATMHGHDLASYEKKFQACGWNAYVIDGHNVDQILGAVDEALQSEDRPSAVIAGTLKGKGVSFLEDRNGWHGKPVKKGEELEKALAELGDDLELPVPLAMAPPSRSAADGPRALPNGLEVQPPAYAKGEKVATRRAYGTALSKLGAASPSVVALDADTKNSTYAEKFMEGFPDRFFECFIAEQNMVGTAVGLGAMGKVPFASTFACFLTRAYDLIRMASISQANLNLVGSHAGVSIGEDGPSQMGLEDLAMMRAVHGSTVFYPCDGVSTEKLAMLAGRTPGIVYIRTSRPPTPVLYDNDEEFPLGGSKVLRSSERDRATVVGAGVTVHEALRAYDELAAEGIAIRVIDLYCVKPVDVETLRAAVRDTGVLVTVEDHYPEGGIGEAVLSALANEAFRYRRLAVNGLPRSGKSEELMDAHGISSRRIVEAVKSLTGATGS